MRKILRLFLVFISCFVLSGCNKNEVSNSGNEKQYIYALDIVEKESCDYKPELYHTAKEYERRIYTYCLDNVKINDGAKTTELKKYLETYDYLTFHEFIRSLIFEPLLYNGETESYKDGGTHKFTNKTLTLIMCGRIFGPGDIYIGPQDMEYKSNFCRDDNATFTRTYTVKNVEQYTEQQYTENGTPIMYGNSFKVTLSQFQAETKTVIINSISTDLKENETYEFEFINNGISNDDIESIIKKSTIVEIRKTEKIGLDQFQDSIN